MRFAPFVSIFFAAALAPAVPVPQATPAPKPTGPPVKPVASAASSELSGTVLETVDSGGYTYLKLKTSSGEVWAAVNQASVRKGSTATVVNPMLMENFESKTLKRKFDRIYFGVLGSSPSSSSPSGVTLPPGHPPVGETMAAQDAAAGAGPSDAGPIKVTKAEGRNARTVTEIYAQKSTLNGTKVVVRGKVVKFLPEIMGKNWLHLRDGSGSPEKKNDDITVTTADTAAVGDVVVVTGTVHIDRDFGAGYAYPVIIEEARISK